MKGNESGLQNQSRVPDFFRDPMSGHSKEGTKLGISPEIRGE
jgi:hypothetical protein